MAMMSVFFNRPLLQSIRRIDPDNFSLAAIGKYRGIPTWAKEDFGGLEEVDVATDGYTGFQLCDDVMELVGEMVVGIRKAETDYQYFRANMASGYYFGGMYIKGMKVDERKRLFTPMRNHEKCMKQVCDLGNFLENKYHKDQYRKKGIGMGLYETGSRYPEFERDFIIKPRQLKMKYWKRHQEDPRYHGYLTKEPYLSEENEEVWDAMSFLGRLSNRLGTRWVWEERLVRGNSHSNQVYIGYPDVEPWWLW